MVPDRPSIVHVQVDQPWKLKEPPRTTIEYSSRAVPLIPPTNARVSDVVMNRLSPACRKLVTVRPVRKLTPPSSCGGVAAPVDAIAAATPAAAASTATHLAA